MVAHPQQFLVGVECQGGDADPAVSQDVTEGDELVVCLVFLPGSGVLSKLAVIVVVHLVVLAGLSGVQPVLAEVAVIVSPCVFLHLKKYFIKIS